MSRKTERPLEAGPVPHTSERVSGEGCTHGRLIDDILTENGKRAGQVRCVECGVSMDDPYAQLK